MSLIKTISMYISTIGNIYIILKYCYRWQPKSRTTLLMCNKKNLLPCRNRNRHANIYLLYRLRKHLSIISSELNGFLCLCVCAPVQFTLICFCKIQSLEVPRKVLLHGIEKNNVMTFAEGDHDIRFAYCKIFTVKYKTVIKIDLNI